MQADQPFHRFEDHTGEVQLHLEAADLAGLFAEAGRALAELMLGEPGERRGEPEEVRVEADDWAGLLFDWINELIFLSETQKLVYTGFEIDEISEFQLVARIQGVEPRTIRTAVKAATFHNLCVECVPAGVTATVVLDV